MPASDFKVNRIKEAIGDRTIITRDELIGVFVEINPKISESAKRNRIHHLIQKGILFPITNKHFTFDVKMSWEPASSKEIDNPWKYLVEDFRNNLLCLWTTKWINEFVNLQAFNEVVFVEAEEIIAQSVYYKLAEKYQDVYYAPDEKEIEFYISTKEIAYVVKPLITRAPVIMPVQGSTSKKSKPDSIPKPPRPRLEKLLTDIYYESKVLSAWKYEEERIWQDAFIRYNINFSTIYNYAERRDNSVRIIDFIISNLYSLPNDIARFLKEK